MARLDPGTEPALPIAAGEPPLFHASSRRHFATITWLRWRIFVNSLRGKGAAGELAVKILSYPFLALMVLGPSVGSAFAGYYLVSKDLFQYLPVPLWIIFSLWQLISLSTSTTGPAFNLASLVRFPIRYRDYLLIRLSFGLLDPPTVAGICCLVSLSLGIAVASPSLFPWAGLTLLTYALCLLLFSRMVYTWMERWLAQRRTRELLTGIVLIGSLGAQFASQFVQRAGNSGHHAHHPTLSPFWMKVIHVSVFLNWLLPPGLAATSIDHFHLGEIGIALGTFLALFAYTAAFFFVFHLRMMGEYRGENLSEAPAATPHKARAVTSRLPENAAAPPATATTFTLLPQVIAACLIKEVRYLLRSGARLYTLALPVFVVAAYSMRSMGMSYTGVSHDPIQGMLFTYGCAYTQLIFVALLYNSLGGDGAGVQFYFMAPVRMRQVMVAKNLLICSIFAGEIVLIYIVAAFISKPAPADLTAATIAWSLFVLFLNLSIGNVRSIASPRVLDVGRVRGQNISGLSGLISLAVVVACIALGAATVLLCDSLHVGYWVAAGIFLLLAIGSFASYMTVLGKLDTIAASHVESLTKTLAKA